MKSPTWWPPPSSPMRKASRLALSCLKARRVIIQSWRSPTTNGRQSRRQSTPCRMAASPAGSSMKCSANAASSRRNWSNHLAATNPVHARLAKPSASSARQAISANAFIRLKTSNGGRLSYNYAKYSGNRTAMYNGMFKRFSFLLKLFSEKRMA